MGIIYGIDLGTTFSGVSSIKNGRSHVYSIGDGSRKGLASVVFLERSGEKIRAKVGLLAFDALKDAPQGEGKLITESKRFIGRTLFTPPREPPWRFGRYSFDPRDIACLILKKIKKEVSLQEPKDPLHRAVVTHPAFFPIPAKVATKQAAQMAGIEVVDTITEPGAAAIAYGANQQKDGYYLVFDLGGGTLDVTVLKVEKGILRLIGHQGDAELGGIDWDREILKIAFEWFEKSYPGIDLDGHIDEQTRLLWMRQCADIKVRLSESDFVKETFSVDMGGDWLTKRVEIRRTLFEEKTSGLVNRTLEVAQQALDKTHIGWNDLVAILPVGGATKMPMIKKMLAQQGRPLAEDIIDPDKAVAIGAAWRGSMLAGGEKKKIEDGDIEEEYTGIAVELRDCLSRDLRVLVTDPRTGKQFCHLIAKAGSETPLKIMERFSTAYDNQTSITVKVYEGEGELAEECTYVGEVRVEDVPERPKGQPVDVTFAISQSGRLEIHVVDVGANRSAKGVIDIAYAKEDSIEIKKKLLDSIEVV